LFGIAQHIGKNDKWKDIGNDSKYKIVDNLFIKLKNANPMVVIL